MSQSPIDPTGKRDSYEAGWGKILEFINTGGSWSGHERNACFLNTGKSQFADVSAVTGLDFMDDGRCVAPVDWDLDGDLDLWLVSRTGPRLRFVRNDIRHNQESGKNTHYVALRLAGKQCNRDAIGARVIAKVDGKQLLRTLHAGDGYLTQSSRWIHVGLGAATHIESIEVKWPGGEIESFAGVEIDGRWTLQQGSGSAVQWDAPQRDATFTPSRVPTLVDTTAPRVVMLDRVPMPQLTFQDLDGSPRSLPEIGGGPTLVNLWATWCLPCAGELKEITDAEQRIRAAGLRVVALSVDGLGASQAKSNPDAKPASTLADAKRMLDNLEFPFESGAANPEILETLDAFQQVLISLRTQRDVLPSSFLLDAHGRLAVIYLGPVAVDQLLTDVERLIANQTGSDNAAFPFVGRWFAPPRRTGPLLVEFAQEFKKRGLSEVALQFAGLAADLATRDAMPPQLTHELATMFYDAGNDSLQSGAFSAARRQYDACLRLEPNRAEAHSNLGSVCHQLGQAEQAKQHLMAALRINPRLIPPNVNLGIILLEEGQNSQAAALFQTAVDLAPSLADAHNYLGIALARMGRRPLAIQHFETAVRYGHPDAQRNLQTMQKGGAP